MRNWRINIVFVLIILFGAAIVSRLIYIQIIKNDFYRALAQGQQGVFNSLKGDRGDIIFKAGQLFATTSAEKYVFSSPEEIEEKEETAEILAPILNIEKELILEKLKKEGLFEIIKNNITEEEERILKEKNIQGVYPGQAKFRSYPQGSMASQLVGFLGGEGTGQYGIEGYYDDILEGKEMFGENGAGYIFGGKDSDSLKGVNLYLSIDYNIQFMAEKLLEQARENLNIESGQIIVEEPNTGKILALANFPNFNPDNYYQTEDFLVFQNAAIQKLYEPGSVFKAITMAAALDREKVNPKTSYVDEGEVKIGGYTIYNYGQKTWGKRTMTEVLERSINTGAVFVEKQLGHNLFLEYVEKFGFFEPTGIDLQGEIFSENKEFKKGYEINYATASFGQGIEITPMQMVRAFSAIANGGKLVKPYVVEKIEKNGKLTENQPEFSGQIISSGAVSQLTAMLVSVVENGSAKKAKIPGYYIAGKTGTSQISWAAIGIDKRGYSEKTWQSFIGFAPAFDAKFLIFVKLDNPGVESSEFSAAPIFRDLAKFIIDYLEIPPDYEE